MDPVNIAIPRNFENFFDTADAVLAQLQDRIGWGLWMVLRREGRDAIVLAARDRHDGIRAGDVHHWGDLLCSRMVRGLGPRVAPRTHLVPAYAEGRTPTALPAGAYLGLPLSAPDGGFFGTLTALDPEPQSESVEAEEPGLALVAQLLSTVLAGELRAVASEREAERAKTEATRDPLTRLFNRRGWDDLLAREDSRCRRYGAPASVLSLSVGEPDGPTPCDELDERLIERAGELLATTVRSTDVVAHLGGGEFGLLAVESSSLSVGPLAERVRRRLAGAGIPIAVGAAPRDPRQSLLAAVERAVALRCEEADGRSAAARDRAA